MARTNTRGKGKKSGDITDYRHESATRKNNPPAKIAAEGVVPALPKSQYHYSPRRPPELRFDPHGTPDALPELLAEAQKRPLTEEETRLLAEALRTHQPWLEWAGKQEQHDRGGFEVDPVALHIHERVSAQAILRVAARQDVQRDLFADPQQEYNEAVQFYRHDIDWSNRLILGDSLQVMSSLARREDLAGKVQMIYIDPPYGIKFASNFQPLIGVKTVSDSEADLTREPEMIRAFRDTWHLGIHSYLTYLRDRLIVARELLADTGSIFAQISDVNVHRLRVVMDDVFGSENFVVSLLLKKKGSQKSGTMDPINDFILWFTKDKEKAKGKFRPVFKLFADPDQAGESFKLVELIDGREVSVAELASRTGTAAEDPNYRSRILKAVPGARLFSSENSTAGGVRKNQSVLFTFRGKQFDPGLRKGNCWKHTARPLESGLSGMERLAKAERLYVGAKQLRLKRCLEDFGGTPVTNWWDDFAGAGNPVYVVQTSEGVVERCLLMTTEPGDLVLDPTCGSGTTAFAAEKWGRRWISIDTSRVALTIARQRLLTSQFDYFKTKGSYDSNGSPDNGFVYRKVPHVTSSAIANCDLLDPIFAKHEPILEERLAACNVTLKDVPKEIRAKLQAKLVEKQRREGKRAITDADQRRWNLPKAQTGSASVPASKVRAKNQGQNEDTAGGVTGFAHWTVPFDTDSDWPKSLQKAVAEYRAAWRAKMDEVNACIAANAEQEELVDQPEIVRGITRVSGPFTVEAVQPPEMSLSDITAEIPAAEFDGAPEELEDTFEFEQGSKPRTLRVVETRADLDIRNLDAYLDKMIRLLRQDGVRFPNNKQMSFTRLERLNTDAAGFHAEGRWTPEGEKDADPEGPATVCVAFGPQYGPVTARMVENLIRPAYRYYDDLVIAGFSFDGAAQTVIEEAQHPKLRIHMAHIRPDVNPGMDGLLKEQPGSQLFTVFGQPRVRLDGPNAEGEYTVTVEGVDIYNPVTNEIQSTGAAKVAAWFLDSDYDGRTFCITQAFFPDQTAWDKLAKALKGVLDEDAFQAFSGTTSLPFPKGEYGTVAVKAIDPRGNEVMKVLSVT
jgi:adenine-specific DNA-methyltransferase